MISFDRPAALAMAVVTRCGPASAVSSWRTTSAAVSSAVPGGAQLREVNGRLAARPLRWRLRVGVALRRAPLAHASRPRGRFGEVQ
eukprot:3909235-Pleurochrysis_carterae.AAC.1